MLNRKKDVKDGKFSQVVSNTLDMKLREDLERLKKIRAHRGLRHYCAPPPPESLPTRPRAVALGPLRADDGFRTTVLSPAQPSFLLQGACACVVSAPRRPAARAAPSVCPRRRARHLRLRCYLRHAAAARWQYCPSCVRVSPSVPTRGWAHTSGDITPLSSPPLPLVFNTTSSRFLSFGCLNSLSEITLADSQTQSEYRNSPETMYLYKTPLSCAEPEGGRAPPEGGAWRRRRGRGARSVGRGRRLRPWPGWTRRGRATWRTWWRRRERGRGRRRRRGGGRGRTSRIGWTTGSSFIRSFRGGPDGRARRRRRRRPRGTGRVVITGMP